MLDKLIAIEAKYSQIEARLAAPETYDDPAQVARLNKEQAELAPLVETFRTYQQTLNAGIRPMRCWATRRCVNWPRRNMTRP